MSHSLLAISLRPGVHALTAVMSVLHARGADIAGMTYCVEAGDASLLLRMNGSADEADLLARQIQRRVDVTEVHVRGRVPHERWPGRRQAAVPEPHEHVPDPLRSRCG